MPNPYDGLLPEGDDLPVTDLDRVALAIGQVLSIVRRPDAPVDSERAVRLLSDALDLSLLPVPRESMKRIDRFGDLLVDAITSVGRRRPELRARLIKKMDDRRREFEDAVEGWAEYDRLHGLERAWGATTRER